MSSFCVSKLRRFGERDKVFDKQMSNPINFPLEENKGDVKKKSGNDIESGGEAFVKFSDNQEHIIEVRVSKY